MIARQRSIRRAAAAVFLLFAAVLGVPRAEASIPRAGDVERGVRASDTNADRTLPLGGTLQAPAEAPRPTFPLGATLAPPRIGPFLVLSGAAPTLALFPVFTPEAAPGAGWKSRYVTEDELGNVAYLTGLDGTVLERYDYETYGRFRVFAPDGSARTTSAFGWNRLFQGREYVAALEAYDFRNRHLLPALGRFIQEDPLGYVDSLNLYQAFGGRWANATDPWGLMAECPAGHWLQGGRCVSDAGEVPVIDREKELGESIERGRDPCDPIPCMSALKTNGPTASREWTIGPLFELPTRDERLAWEAETVFNLLAARAAIGKTARARPSGTKGKSSGLPEFLRRRFAEGEAFNRENRPRYSHNEVEVEARDLSGRKFRVDSYDPGQGPAGVIVSRKNTQLASVKPQTAIKYLNEVLQKYPEGATITDSPFNPAVLRGQRLRGDLVLEVPVQVQPVPREVIDAAAQRGIVIRDVKRTVY